MSNSSSKTLRIKNSPGSVCIHVFVPFPSRVWQDLPFDSHYRSCLSHLQGARTSYSHLSLKGTAPAESLKLCLWSGCGFCFCVWLLEVEALWKKTVCLLLWLRKLKCDINESNLFGDPSQSCDLRMLFCFSNKAMNMHREWTGLVVSSFTWIAV